MLIAVDATRAIRCRNYAATREYTENVAFFIEMFCLYTKNIFTLDEEKI